MRLEVLRLLVLRNVLEERGLVDEAFVARVTLVRLVRLVTSVDELGRKNSRVTHYKSNQLSDYERTSSGSAGWTTG